MIDKDQEIYWEEKTSLIGQPVLTLSDPLVAASYVAVGDFKRAGVYAKFDGEEEFLIMEINPDTNEAQLNFKVVKVDPNFKGEYSAIKFTSPSNKTFSLTAKVIE